MLSLPTADVCLGFSGDDSMSMVEPKAALEKDLKTTGSIWTFFKALPVASWESECVPAWQSRIDELLRLLRKISWMSVADSTSSSTSTSIATSSSTTTTSATCTAITTAVVSTVTVRTVAKAPLRSLRLQRRLLLLLLL